MPKHSVRQPCESCDTKIGELDPNFARFVISILKSFDDCHISTAFRGQVAQNAAFVLGKSRLRWPNSKHNKTDPNGLPNSRAVDLFRIDDSGKAHFEQSFYTRIYDYCVDNKFPIFWGGLWKTLKDFPHFEYSKPK